MEAKFDRQTAIGCGALLVLVVIGAALIIGPCGSESEVKQVADWQSVMIGDTAIISQGRYVGVVLGNSERDWTAYVEAVMANDQMGISELIRTGQVFIAPDSIEALLLNADWRGRAKVRIIGRTDAFGRIGWLARQQVLARRKK